MPWLGLAQDMSEAPSLDSVYLHTRLDSLKTVFSARKTLAKEYELETLIALSHFPQLMNTRITFKQAKIKTTMNARPSFGSLLIRKRTKRNYIIRINKQEKDSIVLFHSIPFDAKIGVIGHELAHLVDYNTRSFFGVLQRLGAYTSKNKKAEFEKEIDLITIRQGLGWPLYKWSHYVLKDSPATEAYKRFKSATYLTPEEILYHLLEQSHHELQKK